MWFYAMRILCHQVFAYALESFSVGLRALDELGHPTAAIISITQTVEVRKDGGKACIYKTSLNSTNA